jgi:hypothetical protein
LDRWLAASLCLQGSRNRRSANTPATPVADRVIFVAFEEVLVEGLRDEIVLVGIRAQQAQRVSLDLELAGVPAHRVVTQP